MKIEFDSSFETLEEEYQECSRTIFIEQSQELLPNKIDCVNTLNILHGIWKDQDPLTWNTMTLQPATQPCLNNSSENFLLDQQHESTLPIDADAGTKVDTKAKELTKSAKKRLKNRLKTAKS